MFRTSKLNAVVVSLIALVAIFTLPCPRAEAQVKPFKIKGGGNAPEGLSLIPFDAGPYTNSGTATHLGRYTGFGIAFVTTDDPGPLPAGAVFNGSFSGGFVFEAANGHSLVCEHPGTFAVYPDGEGQFYAIFDANFIPASLTIGETTFESTGKFTNVSGSFRMIATTEPFDIDIENFVTSAFDFSWVGKGSLDFAKGKKRRCSY
ncbi:MAG: hypothetical protein RIK87_05260 [Fuerstiella sp.]